VAIGPAGQNVVETISVPAGTSSVGPPFQGQFHSWFLDGERFFTYVLRTLWVYSKASVQQDIKTMLPQFNGLAGQGGWFWTEPDLDIYAVGASGSPTASYVGYYSPDPTGMTLVGLATGQATVIDLSGTSVSSATYPLPYSYGDYTSVAATSATQWVVGIRDGRILDGSSPPSAPRYFGIGRIVSIAGSETRFALAKEAGGILYFDAHSGVIEGSISNYFSKLALSSDGSILVGWGNPIGSDRSVRIFSLPSGAEVYTWPYTSGGLYQGPLLAPETRLGR
jgi:hypothetical protein